MASLGGRRGAAGETVQAGTCDLERHNPVVQTVYYLIALVLSSRLGGRGPAERALGGGKSNRFDPVTGLCPPLASQGNKSLRSDFLLPGGGRRSPAVAMYSDALPGYRAVSGDADLRNSRQRLWDAQVASAPAARCPGRGLGGSCGFDVCCAHRTHAVGYRRFML